MVLGDTGALLGIVVAIATFSAPSFRRVVASLENSFATYCIGTFITGVTTFVFIMPLFALLSSYFQQNVSPPSETYTAVFYGFSLISITTAIIFNYQMYDEMKDYDKISRHHFAFSFMCLLSLTFLFSSTAITIEIVNSIDSPTAKLFRNISTGFTVIMFLLFVVDYILHG